MNIKTHLANHWHHYSIGSIGGMLFWVSGLMEKLWEKTEWMRAMAGWVKQKEIKRKRRKR